MRRTTILAGLACASLGVAGGVVYASDDTSPASPARPLEQRRARTARADPAPVRVRRSLPPGSSVVARARGKLLAVYRHPGSARPWRSLGSETAQGTPLVMLVSRRRTGWRQVWLPTRPNGSRGWVRSSTVALTRDDWRIRVHLRHHLLVVHHRGRARWRMPFADGAAGTPTPVGRFYITELLRQPARGGLYGPWAFGLSAHSGVLAHFNGGDGEVGVHGTNEPWLIGRSVSHGCIRLRNRDVARLAGILPLGTPVDVEAN